MYFASLSDRRFTKLINYLPAISSAVHLHLGVFPMGRTLAVTHTQIVIHAPRVLERFYKSLKLYDFLLTVQSSDLGSDYRSLTILSRSYSESNPSR